MTGKVPWSPDSWVKIILIWALASALTTLTAAMAYRAIFSEIDISSATMVRVFEQYIGLFGVVVGYVLGSRKD